MKYCSKCGQAKPLDAFSRDRARRDGLQPHCRSCQSSARKANRERNKARESAATKLYYANNRERMAQIGRDRRDRKKDEISEQQRQWRLQNIDKLRAKDRAWQAKNRAAVLAIRMRRRARKLHSIPGWFGEFDRLVMREAADLLPLREIATGLKWEVDHMIPLQASTACGLHVGMNVQVIPKSLNRSKRNKMILTEPGEWLKVAA